MQGKKAFENIADQVESAGSLHFVPLPQYFMPLSNPLQDNKILDWSKLKQIADDILKCI